MPTIALYASNVSLMPGLISDVKNSVSNYVTELSALKSKTLNVNKSVCNIDEVINSIQSSTQTQEQKIDALDKFQQNSENFIADAVRIDCGVADIVNQSKDDFYEKYNYLKPECEKSDWEKFCEGLASANQWCKENWESVLSLILAVLIVVAVVALCVATFGTGFALVAIGAAALVGAVVGVASQFVADCVTSLIIGEFYLSSWQTYVGAGIGGSVGGMLMLLTKNPVLSCAVDSAMSTFIAGHLQNITGGERTSSINILKDTAKSAALGALFSFLLGSATSKMEKTLSKTFPALSRLAGRGSFAASFKMVCTKLLRGQKQTLSYRTFRNGIVSGLTGSFLENIFDGIETGIEVLFEDKSQPET